MRIFSTLCCKACCTSLRSVDSLSVKLITKFPPWISLICVALYLLTSAIWIRKGKKPELSSAGDAFEEYDFENGQAEKDADEKDETAEETVSADQADADTGDIQEGDGEDHGI